MTDRLEMRLPVEGDRERFVELFQDDAFMAFSAGVNTVEQANQRFDRMLTIARDVPFAKQPVIERSSGRVLGYSGAAWFEHEGEQCLEYGYRLCVEGRGKGYATEAGLALLDVARQHYRGTVYAMVDPTNEPSKRVISKLGFTFVRQVVIEGYLDNFYEIELP